jgi:hypothetical protein
MRHQWFRSRCLSAGSGLVEAGSQTVPGQRLKLSGTHWTIAGASAITTLRCQQARRPDLARKPQPDRSRLTSPDR